MGVSQIKVALRERAEELAGVRLVHQIALRRRSFLLADVDEIADTSQRCVVCDYREPGGGFTRRLNRIVPIQCSRACGALF